MMHDASYNAGNNRGHQSRNNGIERGRGPNQRQKSSAGSAMSQLANTETANLQLDGAR